MKLTINSGLALSDTVKTRINELKVLRSDVAIKKVNKNTYADRIDETTEEPQFDVRKMVKNAQNGVSRLRFLKSHTLIWL